MARTRAGTEEALAQGRDAEAATLITGRLKELTRLGLSDMSDAEADRVGQSAVRAYRSQHPLQSTTTTPTTDSPAGARPGSSSTLDDVSSGLQAAGYVRPVTRLRAAR